jgi:hypothetical protein
MQQKVAKQVGMYQGQFQDFPRLFGFSGLCPQEPGGGNDTAGRFWIFGLSVAISKLNQQNSNNSVF